MVVMQEQDDIRQERDSATHQARQVETRVTALNARLCEHCRTNVELVQSVLMRIGLFFFRSQVAAVIARGCRGASAAPIGVLRVHPAGRSCSSGCPSEISEDGRNGLLCAYGSHLGSVARDAQHVDSSGCGVTT
jgi:hypothetical protein